MATITIPPSMLPQDGRFGSGPSKIRPEQVQALDAGATTVLGTSHRQSTIKQIVGSIRAGLAEFLRIPDDYEIVLGNGGRPPPESRPRCIASQAAWSRAR